MAGVSHDYALAFRGEARIKLICGWGCELKAVVQRVRSARIDAGSECLGELGVGLLALVGIARGDGDADAVAMAEKLVSLRIFADADGRMNRSLVDVGGALGLVSQFTLLGNTRKGRRPSYGDAEDPERALALFERVVSESRAAGVPVVTGRFGADMRVSLVNDGPVTLLIDTRPAHEVQNR